MITRIIEFSVRNRFLVLLLVVIVTILGIYAAENIRLDALPDLSDVQVIIVTEYPGQAPQVVDDQVTYPLTSAMLSVPGSTYVRGYSMFELSFVYVLFEDNTDIYWARSRVLEYLNFARDRLPKGIEPKLGPDATGLGWVYQYILYPGYYCSDHPREARFDKPGKCPIDGKELVHAEYDLAQLRSLQDWYLRYPLTAVEGVSEVASIGGFVKQYQVVLDPERLQAFNLPLRDITTAIERSNNDVGGSVVEISENEYMVRSRGYLKGLDDLGKVVVGVGKNGTPILLKDVSTLQIAGEARRGIGEWNGEGEAVGAVVVSRFGENAHKVIKDVKAKLAELEKGLPPGVMIKTSYDRSALIDRAVGTLRTAVIEELIVIAIICIIFLVHVRSAFIAVLTLPIGLLVSILVMQLLGINANIMSLGGLALDIGVMVDSAVVMIENAHKHLERNRESKTPRPQAEVILDAAKEVGPSLFFSLLVITVSFLPIFVLGEQSGRLFKPLAYTKTFAIAAGAILGITIVPVLMIYLIRGKIPREEKNPVNRLSMKLYDPFFRWVMRHPIVTLVVVLFIGASTLYPILNLGSEFMPPLEEGDLLYMPTTDPSISVTKSKELLQQTDKLIATFPEVVSVHGKIGRAATATDPAPLSMIETVVQLHTDKDKWRNRKAAYFFSSWPGWLKWPFTATFWPEERRITTEELIQGWIDQDGTQHPGLNSVVSLPGVANAWPYPIENRINMLSTGIKTPVGIKVLGPDLEILSDLAERSANAVRTVRGTLSAYPEKTMGGYYLDIDIHRAEAARYGLTVGDVQDVIQSAIGGMNITTTVEGLERYPVNVRYARGLRDNLSKLSRVLVPVMNGAQVPLTQLADITLRTGPPMIKNEEGFLAGFLYVDVTGRDMGRYVEDAKRAVAEKVKLPAGYQVAWSGQYEYLQRVVERLWVVVPITLFIVFLLLYLNTNSMVKTMIILLAVPFSAVGAIWFLYLLDYNMSIAVWVGLIALLGVDAETAVFMLLYLDLAYNERKAKGQMKSIADLKEAIEYGAVKRLRPKFMTVAVMFMGLVPIMWSTGAGSDVMRRIAAPMIGGIFTSFILELVVYPAIYEIWKGFEVRKLARGELAA